jgi:hypothetical protein
MSRFDVDSASLSRGGMTFITRRSVVSQMVSVRRGGVVTVPRFDIGIFTRRQQR